jgi:DNA-binding SARP family transcriptional activator
MAMMWYHEVGNRRAIRERYAALRKLLKEDLGVDPLPGTVEWYESIMAGT